MTARTFHRIIGVLLVLPMVGWAVTGFIFFVKPGYGGAYESLAVKTYPLEGVQHVTPAPDWLEYRVFKTVLGNHLSVRTATGWHQLNPSSLQPIGAPTEAEVRRLVIDAIAANPQRYGSISRVDNVVIRTDTGVEVALDWNRVSLQQKGRDTERIDRLYKVHYLQWTGVQSVDRVLGFVGLSLVLVLTALGVRMALGRK